MASYGIAALCLRLLLILISSLWKISKWRGIFAYGASFDVTAMKFSLAEAIRYTRQSSIAGFHTSVSNRQPTYNPSISIWRRLYSTMSLPVTRASRQRLRSNITVKAYSEFPVELLLCKWRACCTIYLAKYFPFIAARQSH